MNSIMYDGKKSAAESIVYGALAMIETKTKQGPLPVFEQALENVCRPSKCAVGGATYQVPVEVRPVRRQALGIRWIITAARDRNEKTMTERSRPSCSMRRTTGVTPSRSVKTCTGWRKPTVPSRIIAGNGEERI